MRRRRGVRSSRRASRGACPDSSRLTLTVPFEGGRTSFPKGKRRISGGVVADTPEATNALHRCVPRLRAAAATARRGVVFLPIRAEGFEEALRERGFMCEHYRYLSRPIAPGEDADRGRAMERRRPLRRRRPPA